jgi:hypothetical protein
MKPTVIEASYKGATFRAEIDPTKVDEALAAIRGIVPGKNLEQDRSNARAWAIGVIERNDHLKKKEGSALAETLLWLACTSPGPVDALALELVKEGGRGLAYEITGGEKGYGWNFRLILDPAPGVPMPPAPKHPLPGLPGGPSLH